MADRDVIVRILGDSRSYERALKRSEAGTAKFAKKIDSISAGSRLGGLGGLSAFAKGGGIALGAGIAANEIMKLSDAGSDLNEEISKSGQVFGRSSTEIQDWSKTTAESIGIARTQALQASGTFGNLFNTVGIGNQQAAAMSKRLVQLAADLASFNNASPEDTLDALRSGLIGEAEPLRRYGVLLSESRVQQQALADTGKTTAKSLTDQEKAVARYELILKDTVPAQGDFARTSGGLANQQRILRAKLADTQAELGQHLVPVMIKATEAANKFFDALDGNQATATQFLSRDFRSKFIDAFGIDKLKDALEKLEPEMNQAIKDFAKTIQPIPLTIKPTVDTKSPPAFGQPGFKTGKPNETFRPGPSASQRNTIFDAGIARELDRSQDLGIRAQIAALTRIQGEIQQRINITKDITRKLNLEDQIVQIGRQKRSLGQELLDNAAEAKRRQKALAEQAAATKLAQRTARQFRELGLDAEGNPVTASVGNLQKRIASIGDRIAGTKFDTPKLQTQLARFRKVLGEGLVPKDVRGRIQEMLDEINATLNKGAKKDGPLTKTTQLNAERILGGLGLGPDAERLIRARLSHFNSAGKALAGTGASSTIVVQPPPVYLDGALISKNSAKHNARARNVNASRRNGPNAGLIVR